MSQPLKQFDLSRPPDDIGAKLALIGITLFVGLMVGWLVLNLPLLAVIALFVGGVFAAISLVNPYIGLLLYMAWEYIRPAELFPVIAPLHLQRAIAIVVAVAWLLSRLGKNAPPLVKSQQTRAIFAFLSVMFLSVFTAFYRPVALDFTIDFAKIVLVYLMIINLVNTEKKLAIFVWMLVLLHGWVAGGTINSYHTGGVVLSEGIQRATGASVFMGDPNDIATALSAALPFILLLIPVVRNRFSKVGLAILAGGFLLAISFTGSRGGSIGLATVLFVLWLRSEKKLAVGMAMIGLVIGLWVMSPEGYRERLTSILNYSTDATATARRESWKAGVFLFIHHPILGVGASNFGLARANTYVGVPTYGDWQTAHSIYYQLLAELGITGLLVFLWIMYGVFRDTRETRRRIRGRPEMEFQTRLTHAFDISLIGLLSGGAFLSLAYYPILYFLAALVVAQRHILETRLAAEEAPQEIFGSAEELPALEAGTCRG